MLSPPLSPRLPETLPGTSSPPWPGKPSAAQSLALLTGGEMLRRGAHKARRPADESSERGGKGVPPLGARQVCGGRKVGAGVRAE